MGGGDQGRGGMRREGRRGPRKRMDEEGGGVKETRKTKNAKVMDCNP